MAASRGGMAGGRQGEQHNYGNEGLHGRLPLLAGLSAMPFTARMKPTSNHVACLPVEFKCQSKRVLVLGGLPVLVRLKSIVGAIGVLEKFDKALACGKALLSGSGRYLW